MLLVFLSTMLLGVAAWSSGTQAALEGMQRAQREMDYISTEIASGTTYYETHDDGSIDLLQCRDRRRDDNEHMGYVDEIHGSPNIRCKRSRPSQSCFASSDVCEEWRRKQDESRARVRAHAARVREQNDARRMALKKAQDEQVQERVQAGYARINMNCISLRRWSCINGTSADADMIESGYVFRDPCDPDNQEKNCRPFTENELNMYKQWRDGQLKLAQSRLQLLLGKDAPQANSLFTCISGYDYQVLPYWQRLLFIDMDNPEPDYCIFNRTDEELLRIGAHRMQLRAHREQNDVLGWEVPHVLWHCPSEQEQDERRLLIEDASGNRRCTAHRSNEILLAWQRDAYGMMKEHIAAAIGIIDSQLAAPFISCMCVSAADFSQQSETIKEASVFPAGCDYGSFLEERCRLEVDLVAIRNAVAARTDL